MAFCPHCGKSVTDQASKCLACGQEFEPRAKAARFKGTMMMTPAQAPVPPAAASPPSPAVQPAAAKPQPAPAAAAPAARPTTPGPSKVAKATMLGTGGLGLGPPTAAGVKPGAAPQRPPPAAGAALPAGVARQVAPERAPAEPQSTPAAPSAPASPARAAEPSTSAASAPREDSQRFLAGDPMAPTGSPPRSAPRGGRDDGEDRVPVQRTSVLLVVGLLGILVIAVVGYAAARYMGLIQ